MYHDRTVTIFFYHKIIIMKTVHQLTQYVNVILFALYHYLSDQTIFYVTQFVFVLYSEYNDLLAGLAARGSAL